MSSTKLGTVSKIILFIVLWSVLRVQIPFWILKCFLKDECKFMPGNLGILEFLSKINCC